METSECSICFSAFDDEQDTAVTPCGHMFHHACVADWNKKASRTGTKGRCPVCNLIYPVTRLVPKLFINYGDSKNKIEELEASVKELNLIMAVDSSELKHYKETTEKANKEKGELGKKLGILKREKTDLENKNSVLANKGERQRDEIKKISAALAKKSNETKTMKEKIDSLSKEVEPKCNKNKAKKCECPLCGKDKEVDELRALLRESQNGFVESDIKLQKAADDAMKHQKELGEVKKGLAEAEESMAKAKQEQDAIQEELLKSQKKLEIVQSLYNDARSSLDKTDADLKNTTTELRNLKNEQKETKQLYEKALQSLVRHEEAQLNTSTELGETLRDLEYMRRKLAEAQELLQLTTDGYQHTKEKLQMKWKKSYTSIKKRCMKWKVNKTSSSS